MSRVTDRGPGTVSGVSPAPDALEVAGEQPYARKKYLEIDGYRMAYIDEGAGDAIVFQHGNPTSSYLWRNVMGASAGAGRVIACDLIGMGDSDKLDPALGPDRYSFETHRRFLFALWDALDLGDRVVLVLHDVGSMFGFHWAHTHRERVQGIAYMESIVAPLRSTDFPEWARAALGALFTADGERAVLGDNLLLESLLFSTREFSAVEQAHYRKPFLVPGEDRRPMLSFEFPVDGNPPHTAEIVAAYSEWLAADATPKLHIRSSPGYIDTGRLSDLARGWLNQTEITVAGTHFVQESSPSETGQAIAEFVHTLRGPASSTPARSRATDHLEESCP